MLTQPRLKDILQLLMQSPQCSGQDLAGRFSVTVRTIRSDIQALNHLMRGAVILQQRGRGYQLQVQDPETFTQWRREALQEKPVLLLDTMEDRQKYLLALLLIRSGWQDPEDLADEIYVSRNTIQGYLRGIRSFCQENGLRFESRGQKGVRIDGPEQLRRSLFYTEVLDRNMKDYVTGFSPLETQLFAGTDLQLLSDLVYGVLKESALTVSDYGLKNLSLHAAMMIERVRCAQVLEENDVCPVLPQALGTARILCRRLEDWQQMVFPEPELRGMAAHIALNTRLQQQAEDPELKADIRRLLDYIWTVWRFDLRQDPVLQRDLYNHLFSIFQARISEGHRPNPLLNTIQNSFPLAYDISLDAVSHVFQARHLSEDEVGYISLHIGAAVERCYSSQLKPGRVILVCGSGMATARMLEARLRSYFQGKLEITRRCSFQEYLTLPDGILRDNDFVISTVPLPERILPSVTVEFSLTRTDSEAVTRLLSTLQNGRKGPERFFRESLFLRFREPVDKETVLDALCSRLVQEGICPESLQASVAQRETISHTNLNDIFAIPHPMTPSASATRAAVAILDHPVRWNDKCDGVRIVFLLAFCSGEQQDIEHLYDLLLEMVQSVPLQQSILQAETFAEFCRICFRKPGL